MSANEYYTNSNYSSSGPNHQQPSFFDTQQTSNQQQHSSYSYPPQGQAHLHSYDNHLQLQDHAAAGRRRSSAISIPAGAADVSLNPHLAQGFLHHELVPNNENPANHSGTSSVQQHGHPTTSHFCPVGKESNNISHGSDAPNEPIGVNAPNSPDGHIGPDGERGLGATLVGGASGHFLAKQLGHGGGHHHHGVLGTTAGAVAANLLEHKLKKNHDQKNHHQQTQHAHDLGHGHGGGGGGLSGMFGGGGGGGGKHPTLQQQAQQHHCPETHAGSVGHGHGHRQEYGGVNQGCYEHGKHGKWGH